MLQVRGVHFPPHSPLSRVTGYSVTPAQKFLYQPLHTAFLCAQDIQWCTGVSLTLCSLSILLSVIRTSLLALKLSIVLFTSTCCLNLSTSDSNCTIRLCALIKRASCKGDPPVDPLAYLPEQVLSASADISVLELTIGKWSLMRGVPGWVGIN